MSATKYHFNLNEIPQEHRDMFKTINSHIDTAFAKAEKGDKSLTRSGSDYYIVLDSELVEIKQYRQDAPDGLQDWWIASEASARSKWYSDPMPTLKALKESLGL